MKTTTGKPDRDRGLFWFAVLLLMAACIAIAAVRDWRRLRWEVTWQELDGLMKGKQ